MMATSTVTSAVVRDFVCLYTHDLKRKQKRWQDGRLKFHAFNNRVVVHDEAGNFIGDTHWLGDYDIGDGEELQLDRGGVIVQVAQYVGQKTQDISEIFARKSKHQDSHSRALNALTTSRTPSVSSVIRSDNLTTTSRATAPSFHLRHMPLQSLLSTPKAPLGRATTPKRSPYEERESSIQSDPAGGEVLHRSKRRRDEKYGAGRNCYAKSLFGQTLTLSAQPSSSVARVHRLAQETKPDAPIPTPAPEEKRRSQSGEAEKPVSRESDRVTSCPKSNAPSPPTKERPLAEKVASEKAKTRNTKKRRATNEPSADEAMTELQIGSRRKRGLLLVAKKSAPVADAAGMGDSRESRVEPEPAKRCIANNPSTRAKKATAKSKPVTETTDGAESPKERAGQELVGRQTVKISVTKEQKATQKPEPVADTVGVVGLAGVADYPEIQTGPEPQERCAIKNPATRGKKAAQKSDAAGQIPHPVAGLDPVSIVQDRTRNLGGVTNSGAKPNAKRPNESNLPGFSKAGGQPWFRPWSKHAYDLLGETRPTRTSK